MFNAIPLVGENRLHGYLSEWDTNELNRIMRKLAQHFTQQTERTSYDRSTFDKQTAAFRQQKTEGAIPDQAHINETISALGLEQAELNVLRQIGDRFTNHYNRLHRTDLSTKEGRKILLKMVGTDSVKHRSEVEGRRRQDELQKEEVRVFLQDRERHFSSSSFVDKLDFHAKEAWNNTLTNEGYAEFEEDGDWLNLYYKAYDGTLRIAELDFLREPPVVAGIEILDPRVYVNIIKRTDLLRLSRLIHTPNGSIANHGETSRWRTFIRDFKQKANVTTKHNIQP